MHMMNDIEKFVKMPIQLDEATFILSWYFVPSNLARLRKDTHYKYTKEAPPSYTKVTVIRKIERDLKGSTCFK